jgi:hypothetical protein
MGVNASPFGIFCKRCFLHFFIIIAMHVASNWAFTHQLVTRSIARYVATTASIAFMASFSSLSLHFALLCSSIVTLSILFFARFPNT